MVANTYMNYEMKDSTWNLNQLPPLIYFWVSAYIAMITK